MQQDMVLNPGKLVGRHPLPNGLYLEFWDHSRPVASDRWFVLLETRIAVPINPETLPPELKSQENQVMEAMGDEIIFSQKEERNFIGASEFPGLLKEMQDRILALAPKYYGHRDFAARFIRAKFAERQKPEHWQGLDTRRENGA
jgi:hypothetical protein